MFESGKALKFVEEDNYQEGCLPETSQSYMVNIEFEAETLEELLNEIKKYYCADDDEIILNSCEEDGRLDICILEDENSFKAPDYQIEQWKQGEFKLYYAIYSYNIKEVEKRSIRL